MDTAFITQTIVTLLNPALYPIIVGRIEMEIIS